LSEPLRVVDREAWANWLKSHHTGARGVWLIIRKKRSMHPGVFLDEAVEEAIVHGWIDSQMKPLDADEYLLRFTPRRDESPWSLRNREIAERLVAEGQMKEAGLARVEEAKRNGRWGTAYSSKEPPKIPADFEDALKKRGALEHFRATSNSNQLQYIFWVDEAKRQETRARRIKVTIDRIPE
jgi:uncharacterized protein YdeI (YjbR/CyaY-like superfamily)